MAAKRLIEMVDMSFGYFEKLGDFKQDPAGVAAVRQVRDQMVEDLNAFETEPSAKELKKLCRQWRKLRIESKGKATYPPDMFIESVCQVIELS